MQNNLRHYVKQGVINMDLVLAFILGMVTGTLVVWIWVEKEIREIKKRYRKLMKMIKENE